MFKGKKRKKGVDVDRTPLPPATLNSYLKALTGELDSPVATALYQQFDKGDHNGLLRLDIDPARYTDPDLFRRDYLAVSILSKYPALNTGIDTKEVAIRGFWDAEAQCAEANRTFRAKLPTSLTSELTPHAVFHLARGIIHDTLGPYRDSELFANSRFSSGATVSLRRSMGILTTSLIIRIPR